MRMPFRFATLAIVACAVLPGAHGQQSSEEATTDGGGTPDVLESIFVPALPNAPFSMTLATEWTRLMNNGGNFVSVNARELKRDTAGRIYMERWMLVPKGSDIPSAMTAIQIADPVARVFYQCIVSQHTCAQYQWSVPALRRYEPGPTGSRPMKNGRGFFAHEDLGEGDALGVPVHLYRDTTTLNAGTFGNDKPLVTTREFSYSPRLGINLRSVLDTPQVGRQQFVVTAVTLSEPEARFFAPPAGFRVIDRRGGTPVE